MSPAHKPHLEPGDVLVRVNGEVIYAYLEVHAVFELSYQIACPYTVTGGSEFVKTLFYLDESA